MPSSTVEDYVKAIYTLQQESATGEATVVRIAATLGVTKGSVTAMVRKLREADLADAKRYGGVRLTQTGETLALDVIRRHRIIELFLVETLGFDWSEVHDEAERLEHAMSPKLLDRLDAFLGGPTTDPHGDPIPDAEGRVSEDGGVPLSEFRDRQRGEITRITDQEPDFLRFIAEHDLRPGTPVRVIAVRPAAESIEVRPGKSPAVSMSLLAARKIYAEPAD